MEMIEEPAQQEWEQEGDQQSAIGLEFIVTTLSYNLIGWCFVHSGKIISDGPDKEEQKQPSRVGVKVKGDQGEGQNAQDADRIGGHYLISSNT